MKMSYQSAKNIRERGIFGNISKKIVEGQGIGSSIGSSISDSVKARAVGIKQKFDPLNIAKVMTFGSNWAPALLGRATDRSDEDLQFFSNVKPKQKKIEELKKQVADNSQTTAPTQTTSSKQTATKVRPKRNDEVMFGEKKYRWMGAQWGEVNPETNREGRVAPKNVSPHLFQIWANSPQTTIEPPKSKPAQSKLERAYRKSEVIDTLQKIYSLLKKAETDRRKFIEIEKDFDKERRTEDERRHKELINAFLKIGVKKKKKYSDNKPDLPLSLLLPILGGSLLGLKPFRSRLGEWFRDRFGEEEKNRRAVEEEKAKRVAEEEKAKRIAEEEKARRIGEEEKLKRGGEAPRRIGEEFKLEGEKPKVRIEPKVSLEGFDNSNLRLNQGRIEPTLKPLPPVEPSWVDLVEPKVNTATKVSPVAEKPKATKISQRKLAIKMGAYRMLEWIASNPWLARALIGYDIGKQFLQLFNETQMEKMSERELYRRVIRIFVGVGGGILAAELGGLVGSFAGATTSGVTGPFGPLIGGVLGSVGGYYAGVPATEFIFDMFTDPNFKPPQIFQKDDPSKRHFEGKVEKLPPNSRAQSLNEKLSSVTNENSNLNFSKVASAKPVILENNRFMSKNGPTIDNINPGDALVRNDEASINWSITHSIRAV